MKRKLIFNLAMSLDGYIADEHGRYDWIEGDGTDQLNTKDNFDFTIFLKEVDTVVMGSKSCKDCPRDSSV